MNKNLVWVYSALIFFVTNITTAQESNSELDSIDWSIDLDQFIVTGTYSPVHYKRAMHQVEVIKASEIESRGANTLDEALELIPSINIVVDPFIGTHIKLRGVSANHVTILIDGVPVIGRIGGGVDLSQIALQNVKRIEVVQGPLSNIYGNNAAGGAINIITKKHQEKKLSFSSDHQYETIGAQSHQATLGLKLKKWSANIRGRYYDFMSNPVDSFRIYEKITLLDDTEFFRKKYPWNPKEQYSYGGSLMYTLDNENHIRLKYDKNNEDLIQYGPIRRPRFNPYAQDNYYNTYRDDISLSYEGKLWNKLQINALSSRNEFNRNIQDKRYYIEADTFDNKLTKEDKTELEVYQNRFVFAMPILQNLEGTLGITNTQEKGRGSRFFNNQEGDSSTIHLTETATFLELQYKISEKTTLGSSGRFRVNNNFKNRFTPSIQLKHDFSEQFTMRLSYAEGYRTPNLKEQYLEFIDIFHNIIGNTNLRPELSKDVQFQFSYETKKKNTFSLNLYKTAIKDKIQLFEYEPYRYRYQNIEDYDYHGCQASANWEIKNIRFSHGFSINYVSTNLDTLDAKKYLHTWNSNHSLSYTISDWKTSLRLDYRYTGERPNYIQNGETLTLSTVEDNHMLHFSSTTKLLKGKIILGLGIKNILDVQRSVIRGGASGAAHSNSYSRLIDQGRSYFVRLGLRF